MPDVEEELPRDRHRVVPVRLLHEQYIPEFPGIAVESQAVLVATAPLHFTCIRQPEPRLPEEVEADIGICELLLQHRAMPDPFPKPLGKDEGAVAEPQQVLETLCGVSHRFPFRCSQFHLESGRTSDVGKPCPVRDRTRHPSPRDSSPRYRSTLRPRC